MHTQALDISNDIPGVFDAKQERSVRIRDAFINAGVDALNSTRFGDLKITALAEASMNSVGSFYTRFKDKDAYFRALRVHAIDMLDQEIGARFSAERLAAVPPHEALEMLVDLMGDIFCSRFRGVLREALLRILEPDDPWAPMRDSARRIVAELHAGLKDAFPDFPPEEARRRLSFCFQMIVGVLQNDLVNDYHVFSTRDQSIRTGLKDAVCSYMGCREGRR